MSSSSSPNQFKNLHEMRPISKPASSQQAQFYSDQPGQNLSLSSSKGHTQTRTLSDGLGEEGRLRREIVRLRERVDQLEAENIVIEKARIEYENEIGVWQDKARRLNEELIEVESRKVHEAPRYEDCMRRQNAIFEEEKLQLMTTIRELT